jgi:hypothetical protein
MKDTGGPAFPSTHPHGRKDCVSLRDWFAGMAMQGLLACPVQPQSGPDMYVRDAYTLADAMLKERSKE